MQHVRFSPDQRRSTMVAIYPMAASLIPDYPGDLTILATAMRTSQSITHLMTELAKVCQLKPPVAAAKDWTQESIAELIAHLESKQHPYLFIELDRLSWLLHIEGSCSPQLAQRLHRWIELKFHHMQHEERELFPLCRSLDQFDYVGTSADEALRLMYASHENAGLKLLEICRDFALELNSGTGDPKVRDLLLDIVNVLDSHVELEDTILLPAVVFAGEVTRSRRFKQSLAVLRADPA